ncbi:MAG: ACT domain-containing protein, partial [Polyangia bacterium]
LIVNDTDKATQVLKAQGFTVAKTEVVGVQVPDRPGGLAEILNAMKGKQVNVEYMYAFVHKSAVDATIIFRFDDQEKGIACLQQAGIKILQGQDLYSM